MKLDPPYKPDTLPTVVDIEYEGCIYKTYYWSPQTYEIKGRVLFVHGFKDGVECYWELVNTVTRAGFGFFYYDQIGEGQTKMADGSVGINSTDNAIQSLNFFVNYEINEMVLNNEPLELHLMSHSLGGGIMLTYATSSDPLPTEIKSFSSIGPYLKLCTPPPSWWTNWIGSALCHTSYGASLRVNLPMTAEQCTSDQKVIEWSNKTMDLTLIDGALQEVRDGVMRGKALMSPAVFKLMDKDKPVLLCHGESDTLTSPIASKELTQNWCKLGHTNKYYKGYPLGRHSLHMDVESIRLEVCHDLLKFINTL